MLLTQGQPVTLTISDVMKQRRNYKQKPEKRFDDYKVGDKVCIYLDSRTDVVKGTITEVRQDKVLGKIYRARTTEKEVLDDLNCFNLELRNGEDLSKVVISEKVKKIPTPRLRNIYKHIRLSDQEALIEEIKAELQNRERRKREEELLLNKMHSRMKQLEKKVEWQEQHGKYNTREAKMLNKMALVKV